MDAYRRNICCETVVIIPPPPPNVCCQPQLPMYPPIRPFPTSLPPTQLTTQTPLVIVPPPTRPVVVLPPPSLAYPPIQSPCCATCTTYGYYGPPPCVRFTLPRNGPSRILLYVPPIG
ncbi:uncharacterized protein LOC105261985 [Musca domestica]|uniref:Classical arabinogalactan protein 9-like n=1 Tax=Musca domestica TaxID=7370 RepID=A0A1I8NL02_MUSDO|nr:uncharacterized protein LOC105261985 [Musca domestica]